MAENRELALVLKLVADEFKSELKNSQGVLGQFNDFIKDWKTQLAAAGTALFALAKSTANFGEEMLKGAQKAGTSVQVFSALSHAAKMADVDNQLLITGLKSLSVNMVEAQQKTGDGEALFRRLGVAAVDAAGKLRPTEAVLLDLAEVFSKSADGAGKSEAAVKLFGKAGLELIPFLNKGQTEIAALMAEAQRLGLVLSKDDAEAADKFNDALKQLDAQVKGLTVSIGLPLVRGLTDVLQMFTEVEAAVKRAGDEMAGFSKHLSENFGKTGVGQGLMDLFSAMGLGHRKGEGQGPNEKALLDALGVNQRVAARHAQEGREVHAEIKKPFPVGGGGGEDEKKKADEQVRLGAALMDIYRSMNNAKEITKKHIREELDLMFRQEQIEDEGRKKRDERNRSQLVAGLDNAERMLAANEQAERQELDGRVKLAQAWIAYDNQVGASTDQRYTHQVDLLRATLTKETQLRQDEAARLLIAWQNNDKQLAADVLGRANLTATERETIERQYLTRLAGVHQEFSGSIFEGWKRGLDSYVRNTDSAFGFAAQMAQRTAQFMEQSFRTFFFDLMDGRIKSMKDLFKSFGDFVKQVIAQVMAQLATMVALKAITGGFGGFGFGGLFGGGGGLAGGANAGGLFGGLGFNAGGIVPRRFASGGAVLGAGNRDTVAALLTPGEGVLNRRGMATLDRLNAGDLPTSQPMNVTVNVHNSGRTDAPQVNYRRQLKGMIVDIIWRDPDLRQALGGAA